MSTSQNGWPALASGDPLLHRWVIPGAVRPTELLLRQGSAGFLLCHLALWFDHQVEQLVEPQLDDWGYSYRPVRGYTTTLSNHSSGTAVDLNATDHPLGVDGTFTDAQHKAIERRLDFYHGVIRWGGDYHERKDEMHFEIVEPLTTCEDLARSLLDTPRGRALLKANPGQRKVVMS